MDCPWHKVSFATVTFMLSNWPTVTVTCLLAVHPMDVVAVTLYVVVVVGVAVGDCTFVALSVPLFGPHEYVMPVPELGVAVNGRPATAHSVVFGVMERLNAGSTCTCTESW